MDINLLYENGLKITNIPAEVRSMMVSTKAVEATFTVSNSLALIAYLDNKININKFNPVLPFAIFTIAFITAVVYSVIEN